MSVQPKTREEIVEEAKRVIAEIDQMFIDAEYWNDNVRLPHNSRIDPDPTGNMVRIKKRLETMLEGEKK